jgi:hypothetical protein
MLMQAFGGVGVRADNPERAEEGAGRSHRQRQADPHQRHHRRDRRHRERPHHQPESGDGEEEEANKAGSTRHRRIRRTDFET